MRRYPDQIEGMDEETIQRFFELYHNECTNNGQTPSLSDFLVWYEEKYGDS